MNLRKEDLEKQFKGGIEKRNQLLNVKLLNYAPSNLKYFLY